MCGTLMLQRDYPDVAEFLAEQNAYGLHFPAAAHNTSSVVVVPHPLLLLHVPPLCITCPCCCCYITK